MARFHRGSFTMKAIIFCALYFGAFACVASAGDLIKYAKNYSRSHDAVNRVYDEVGIVIETHEHIGDFKEW
jgi:hypothetical protein